MLQVGVELLLRRPGGAVDALQHRRLRIAAPIGAGHLHQLEGLAELAGRRHMRAAAQIEPIALPVDLQILVAGNRVDELDLERLAMRLEPGLRLIAAPDLAW